MQWKNKPYFYFTLTIIIMYSWDVCTCAGPLLRSGNQSWCYHPRFLFCCYFHGTLFLTERWPKSQLHQGRASAKVTKQDVGTVDYPQPLSNTVSKRHQVLPFLLKTWSILKDPDGFAVYPLDALAPVLKFWIYTYAYICALSIYINF